jgi:hypothetical protein
MLKVTLVGIRLILNDQDTIFMKRGSGKVVHLSAGDCRQNNLLCGVTYSRNGNRSSYLRALTGYTEINTTDMCKNCLKIVQNVETPVKAGA